MFLHNKIHNLKRFLFFLSKKNIVNFTIGNYLKYKFVLSLKKINIYLL